MAMKHSSASALLLAAFVSLTALTHAAPTINTNPSSATPVFGATITLSASVTAQPAPTFAWTRGSTAIINGGRYSGAATATLVITGANIGDNGSYILTITDGTGSSATTPASVTVTQTATDRDPATASLGSSSTVNSILHLPDGRTLVGGNLSGASASSTSSRLSIVQTNYQVTSTPVGTFDASPTRLIRQPDGKILVLGAFTSIGGITGVGRTYLARLNADLTLDISFIPPIPNNVTSAAVLDDQGRIYLGGSFTLFGGRSDANYLVRLLPNGALDTTFPVIVNNAVTDIVSQADGKIIIGGNFSAYGPTGSTTAVQGIIRLLSTGAYDSGFSAVFATPSGTLLTGIRDLAFDSQQRLLVASYYLGAAVPNGIVRLLSTGAKDTTFNFTETVDQLISVIEPAAGDKVLVGGVFTAPVVGLLRLNNDGSRDTAFTTELGTGFGVNSANLLALTPDAYGRLWIGGGFGTFKSTTVNRLLVLQGGSPPSLAFTSQPLGSSAALASTATLTATAAASNGFTFQWRKNGNPLSDGGRISGATTGTLSISTLIAGDEADYSVVLSSPGQTSLTSQAAHLDVLGIPEITLDPIQQTADIGGSVTFTGAATGATTLTYQWYYGITALVNGPGVSGATTNTLTLTNIDFNDAGQFSLKAMNGLGDDTSAEATLTVQKRPGAFVAGNLPTFVGVGYGGYVSSILPLTDGSYIVGGNFSRVTINGVNTDRNGLARIKADGTLDTTFPTVKGTSRPTVEAMVIDTSGRIFIGGDFTSVVVGATETPRLRVARLTSAFALDTAFNTSTVGPDKIVRALATAGDGSVYIGGEFTTIGTTATRYMAKLNASGARDAGFTNSISTGAQDNNKSVNSIVRLANGTLYVGSNVSFWGSSVLPGQPAGRLVKLSASGARDFAFASPDVFTIINTIIALPDGSLFAGGNPVTSLKRRNGSTGADLGFTLAGHSIQNYALHRQADGKLLSGSYGVLKRTDANLNVDPSFDVGTGFNGYIRAITTDSAGRIYVGGEFGTFNGNPLNRFVIFNGGDLDSRTTPKPGQTITFADIADRAFVPGNAVANSITITLPTSSSALPVTTIVTSGPATLTGNKLVFTGAGTVVLTASQAGNDNFMAASVSQTIEVSKAMQTLTFAALIDRPTGTAPFLLGAAASSGLPVSYQVLNGPASVNGNVLTLTGPLGTVTLRASQPGNSDFTAAATVDQSFEVFTGTPALLPQTIVFNPLSPRSLSQPLTFTINASATSGLPVNFTFTGPVTSVVGNTVTLSGVTGTVAITAKQAGNGNFLAAADVKQSFTVTAAATALTLTNLIQTYTGTPRAIGTVGGVGTPMITYGATNSATPPTNAGTYPVKAIAAGVTKTGSLVINKAPLIIAADDKRKFTGQDNPALSFAYSGFLSSDNALNALSKAPTVATTATKTSPGGLYPITPVGGTATNYAFVYVKGSLNVETFAGSYEALMEGSGPTGPVGKVEITVLANSTTFTGKLTTAKHTAALPLNGTLLLDIGDGAASGNASATVGTGETAAKYVVSFHLNLDGDFSVDATRATGTPAGTAQPFGTDGGGQKLVFPTGIPPVGYAGAHTLLMGEPLPLVVSALPLPAGAGYATALIDSKGKMTLMGALPDGTKFTTTLMPDKNFVYRLYLLPYASRLDSYFAGALILSEHPDLSPRRYIALADDVNLYWAKQAKTADSNYRSGIPESSMLTTLDPWLPPIAAKLPNPAITLAQHFGLNVTGEMDVLYDGPETVSAPGIPEVVNLTSTGLVTVPGAPPNNNPRAWKLTIAAATGLISGSFTVLDGTVSRTVTVTGVMRQPADGEDDPADIGAGQGQLPQLTGSTAGTTTIGISFERPALE
jgi:uncharacterized delta-60 repeat protein